MTIWNFGSINIDYFYGLDHLPAPGETIPSHSYVPGLGGKGANQSVAVARAGSRVVHVGAIGAEGVWARDRMANYGVETERISVVDGPSGHAIILVETSGENAIVLFPGANHVLAETDIAAALDQAAPGDILMLQNETLHQPAAARIARDKGLRVIYSAAPFSAEAVRAVMDHASILVMNRIESEELRLALGTELASLPVEGVLVTLGGDGASYLDLAGRHMAAVPAFPVAPVDTTGAGDTFTGYFAAGLDQGMEIAEALKLASAAAALKVTRHGAADAIPDRTEVDAFLRRNGG